jgi:saccharopine dehydrogenase-like NADP-dependent oxidoreductase
MARFTVLVLGGTGVFGSRISRRLAADRAIRVLVAGRSAATAERMAAELRSEMPAAEAAGLAVTAPHGLGAALAGNGVDLVVNCVGPFQGQGYEVPEACIRHRVHYIDIADGRDFVCNFPRLDAAARAAGVLAVSGASSVPGLSSAAVAALARDFTRLDRLAIGIAPGNRQPRGLATTASILGYVGRPVRVWRDGRWTTLHGWQDLERRGLATPSLGRLSPRWFALCDVPDLALFPEAYPELRSVSFHAGLELGLLQLGLWLLSWPVRWQLIGGLEPLAAPLTRMARWLAPLGSDRGGMFVELAGVGPDGNRVERSWVLMAGSGHGPWIPTLPAVILARQLARGAIGRRGAMPCLGLVTLEAIEAECADLDIRTELVAPSRAQLGEAE